MAMHQAVKRIDLQHAAAAVLLGALLSTSSFVYADTSATTAEDSVSCGTAKSGASRHTGNFYSGETHLQITDLQQNCGLSSNVRIVVLRQEKIGETAVSMDQSAAGRIHTRLFLRKDPNSTEASEAFAKQVGESFNKSLTKNLKNLHFDTAVDPADKTDERDAIIVQVELTQIDAGNKTKRIMIGLGRGASEVAAKVTLISRRNGKEVPLQQLSLDSQSGKKLGELVSPLGGVSAADIAEGDVGDRKSTAQADAARMAKGLAQYLNKLIPSSSGTTPIETASDVEPLQTK